MDKMFTWAFFSKDHTAPHYLQVINIAVECVCHRLIFMHAFFFLPRCEAVEAPGDQLCDCGIITSLHHRQTSHCQLISMQFLRCSRAAALIIVVF